MYICFIHVLVQWRAETQLQTKTHRGKINNQTNRDLTDIAVASCVINNQSWAFPIKTVNKKYPYQVGHVHLSCH